jgi:iron-sulfur cluster insertion protein
MSTSTGIEFTEAAAEKVAKLIVEEGNPNLNLRVYVYGGGCSGFQYGFTFDDVINEDDTEIEKKCSVGKGSVKLLVDSLSYPYLINAKIDYEEGIQGAQFKIHNPNAQTTCGCGSSFSMADEEI